jgi:anaphase-promoting complex subunit 11
MRVKVNNWNAVATWVWDIKNQTDCTICQLSLESPCPKCKNPGDDCPPRTICSFILKFSSRYV